MNTSFALTSLFIVGLFIGNMAVTADTPRRDFEAKSSVNNTADVVTETEVYRMKCTEIKDGICLTYSIERVTKE